jgi:hypothetical protein
MNMQKCTSKWSLSVNTSNTKIVVFRNGGKVNANEKWFYDNKEIEVVDSFTYLGNLHTLTKINSNLSTLRV